jgi:hypothetical protein
MRKDASAVTIGPGQDDLAPAKSVEQVPGREAGREAAEARRHERG